MLKSYNKEQRSHVPTFPAMFAVAKLAKGLGTSTFGDSPQACTKKKNTQALQGEGTLDGSKRGWVVVCHQTVTAEI